VRKHSFRVGKDIIVAAGPDRHHSDLPASVELYARTPDLTHLTAPAEFTSDRILGEGVWSVLRVLDGVLLLHLGANRLPLRVRAGATAFIEPEVSHRFHFEGPTRFFIEFHLPKSRLRANMPSGRC
jgi:hypothetical protein